ncbi:MAG: hypothetical protein A3D48_04310 [Candidatus Yanofskybacteria bacterium RIFCSPHIGHO2_02_FULL_43_17]|nr:MAG: hypothetical protein A3D48_04310 [Candidatus Yanofskybacteria bacterium RIFCSPHIGHO2_02_FULL_43_17]
MRNYTIQKIAAASLTAVTGCIPLEQERNYVENASTIKGLVENVNSITGDPDDNFALMTSHQGLSEIELAFNKPVGKAVRFHTDPLPEGPFAPIPCARAEVLAVNGNKEIYIGDLECYDENSNPIYQQELNIPRAQRNSLAVRVRQIEPGIMRVDAAEGLPNLLSWQY